MTNERHTLAPSFTSVTAQPARRGFGRRTVLGGLFAGVAAGVATQVFGQSAPTAGDPDRTIDLPQSAPPADQQARQACVFSQPSAAELRDWAVFKAKFIQPDGRVVDSYNNGISHTESQGLGMLFSVTYNDRDTFDRIWQWTQANLSRPNDALFAWRYDPAAVDAVADTNNATDGDIYIAGALSRAACKWGSDSYVAASSRIAADILTLLVMPAGDRTILLPAATGFVEVGSATLNPSYYVFPMLAELQAVCPSPVWAKVIEDGRRLIAEAKFGKWQLPSDWVQVSLDDGSVSMPSDKPARFSFDAVRVPLFAKWDRGNSMSLQRFCAFWGRNPAAAPAWVDLASGEQASFQACGGVVAIAALVAATRRAVTAIEIPAMSSRDNYYSGALILLSRMALRETAI